MKEEYKLDWRVNILISGLSSSDSPLDKIRFEEISKVQHDAIVEAMKKLSWPEALHESYKKVFAYLEENHPKLYGEILGMDVGSIPSLDGQLSYLRLFRHQGQ